MCLLLICCTMCVLLFLTLDARLLAISQHSEGHATGHLHRGFSWFPCVFNPLAPELFFLTSAHPVYKM